MKKSGIFLGIIFAIIYTSKGQTPELNLKIVNYVNSQIGRKVNRGECWDLAYEALNQNNCEWDGMYIFGKKINAKNDVVYPGDILQFTNVTIKYTSNGVVYTESYKHHTAIIFKVISLGVYEIAHQNNGFSGKKVGISDLILSNKTTGTIEIYRPQEKK
ncbi:MAG: hypothetical protein WCQ95_14280 [Bacteroidota bacterium]